MTRCEIDTDVIHKLKESDIEYRIKLHRQPAYTAEAAARERGVPLERIVKTMVLKRPDGRWVVALVPGHRKLNLRKLRHAMGINRLRLATREELEAMGLTVGAISPLCEQLRELPMWADEGIFAHEWVDVSAGTLTAGVELRSEALMQLLNITVADIT